MLARKAAFVKDEATRATVEAFQRWVTHDVLPALRRDGAYVASDGTEDEREGMCPEEEAQTYLHELVHAILAGLARNEEYEDETLTQGLAIGLQMALFPHASAGRARTAALAITADSGRRRRMCLGM